MCGAPVDDERRPHQPGSTVDERLPSSQTSTVSATIFVVVVVSLLLMSCAGSTLPDGVVASSTFRTNAVYGRHVAAVALRPSSVVPDVASPTGCAGVCGGGCQSYVYLNDRRTCLVYATRFMRTSDVVPDPGAVYMEKYPPIAFQVCYID